MAAEERTPVIAIVDDEEMVLTSLRSFLLLETDYEVETWSSPAQALQNLAGNALRYTPDGGTIALSPTRTSI